MLASHTPGVPSRSPTAIHRALDLVASPEGAFHLLCEIEKWPVWLSFLRSARRLEDGPMRYGSEIAVRSGIPGEDEELYEVDQYLEGHILSLVGAYSVRRRFDFRLERKNDHTKIVVRVDYPAYGGAVGAFLDRMTARRRLETALEHSLLHFKGLAEFRTGTDDVLADF